MTTGKLLWGSTRYFINIEPNTNLFSTALGGTVSFHDKSGLINERLCKNLHEVVKTVFEFWATILAPHETRVARWIEEFLQEMGINADYKLILRLLKTDTILEKPIEDLIVDTKTLDTRKQEESWDIEEDTRVIGKENTLSELPDDEYAKKELIFKIIEDNKYNYPEKVKSTNSFRAPDGKLITAEKDNSIFVGEGIGDFVIKSELENEYDAPIKDIKIIDQIPYCFKINKIDFHGSEVTPLKNKNDEFLEIIWNIPELAPKQKFQAKYDFRRRINRTILEILDKKIINTLNVFETIKTEGLQFVSKTKYLNVHNRIIDELYITDDIPPEFEIQRSNPDVIPPSGTIEKAKMKGTTIRWLHKNVNMGQVLTKTYQLDYYPYLFRAKKVVENESGEIIIKSAKFIYLKSTESGYTILYVIKSTKNLDGVVSIEDKIPLMHVITRKNPEDIQIIEENKDNYKKMTLILDVPEENEERRVYLKISGDTSPMLETFSIFLNSQGEKEVLERKSEVFRDLIRLPE